MSKINVTGIEVTVLSHNDSDYICLTDMAKKKDGDQRAADVIKNWIRTRTTIEFLGIWEQLNNENFKVVEFDHFRKEAGLPTFVLSPTQWVDKTGAIGIYSKSGKYGGTYAHKDIAFEFGSAISPLFKLYLIKEFQKLKDEENKLKGSEWDYRRFLTKVNYKVQTDAIKEKLENLPIYKHITKEEAGYIYANEAEMLNVAVFGITSKQWRIENVKQVLDGLNIRDVATIPQLTVLNSLETYNAVLITEGKPKEERLSKLKEAATMQLKSILSYNYTYPIESPHIIKYQQNSTFDSLNRAIINTPKPYK